MKYTSMDYFFPVIPSHTYKGIISKSSLYDTGTISSARSASHAGRAPPTLPVHRGKMTDFFPLLRGDTTCTTLPSFLSPKHIKITIYKLQNDFPKRFKTEPPKLFINLKTKIKNNKINHDI
jgi:hypothetical protein